MDSQVSTDLRALPDPQVPLNPNPPLETENKSRLSTYPHSQTQSHGSPPPSPLCEISPDSQPLLSPPLRKICPQPHFQRPPKPLPVASTIPIPNINHKPTVTQPHPPSQSRFPYRTTAGERQCTNCGETDTPQWRGTLCNACALWKRSRGTDRPLPLLFPVRKRRSPSFDDDEDEEGDQEREEEIWEGGRHPVWGDMPRGTVIGRGGMGSAVGSGRKSGFGIPPADGGGAALSLSCLGCGSREVVGRLYGKAVCGRCFEEVQSQRKLTVKNESTPLRQHQYVRDPGNIATNAARPMDVPLSSSPSRSAHQTTTRQMLYLPSISSDRPHFRQQSSDREPQANAQATFYHTPVSPLRGPARSRLSPRMAALLAATGNGTTGRRRSATVTANGRDDWDHPGATVHLHPHPYRGVGNVGTSSRQYQEVGWDRVGERERENKRYRLSPSIEAPDLSGTLGMTREEWMLSAARMWDLFERVERTLALLESKGIELVP